MTVRSNNSLEKDSSNALFVPATESRENHSPPSKKLRLSLKGQKILGSINHSSQAFPKPAKPPLKMQNMRPNLLDPMSLHANFSVAGMGHLSPSYSRADLNGENDSYERERERPMRMDQSLNDKSAHLPPVATLLNLGNTCFLNSVLYTLRFTPGFAHLLHHLAADLSEKKLLSSMVTSERKIGFLSSGSPGMRTKSLSSLSPFNADENVVPIDPVKRKTLVLTERLHELLQTLHNAEQKGDLSEPFQADAFLQALREVNPLFQGNQQQDAHELLVCFLDYLREACQLVDKAQVKPSTGENSTASTSSDQTNSDAATLKRGKQNSEKKKKGKKIFADKEKDGKKGKRNLLTSQTPNNSTVEIEQPVSTTTPDEPPAAEVNPQTQRDFISESFEGVTVLRTTCLECEFVTERKESFMDICVPIVNESTLDEAPLTPSAFYASALMEVDFLRDSNKYWCEQCVRYNEARRSVHYEKMPRLLVLQLKRFSFSYGSTIHTSKVNDYMPTPMQLDCFCEHCQASPESPLHSYKLYAIIMHLGATMASGHYVAYTRVSPSTADYASCTRSKASASTSSSTSRNLTERNNQSSSSGGILRFFKPKSSSSLGAEAVSSTNNASPHMLCRSVNCCSPRPRKLLGDTYADKDREKERDNSGRESPASSSSCGSTYNMPDDLWLECDDEVIRVLRMRELEDLLSRKPRTSALTPYLLFYVQVTPTAPTNGMK